jgi:hypothetical protein
MSALKGKAVNETIHPRQLFLGRRVYVAPFNPLAVALRDSWAPLLDPSGFLGFLDFLKEDPSIVPLDQVQFNADYVIIRSLSYAGEIARKLEALGFTSDQLIFALNDDHFFTSVDAFARALKRQQKKNLRQQRCRWWGRHLPDRFLSWQSSWEDQRLHRQHLTLPPDPWLAQQGQIHQGKRCFILATGPSLNRLDLSLLTNECTIGVNGIYKLSQELNLDYFIYVSDWYWKHHLEGLRSFVCGRKILPSELKPWFPEDSSISWLKVHRPMPSNALGVEKRTPLFFSRQADRILYAGGTVVFLALQLAYFLGFSEVILLGLDHRFRPEDLTERPRGGYTLMTGSHDLAHFDPDYVPPRTSYKVDLLAMETGYAMAKKAFAMEGRRVVNASPGSHLDVFPQVRYEDLFS